MTKYKNIAIIMDGNGRWANARFKPRIWGHIRGANRVSEIAEYCDSIGVRSLTLYAFSTENWSRPKEEVLFLFKLLDHFIKKESKRIISNNIRFKVIGDYSFLPEKTINRILELENKTKNSSGLILDFAFGYGGRAEIVGALNRFLKNNPDKKEINENDFNSFLLDPDVPEIDLVIRTGGDKRLSNFLLWQIAYAELAFTKVKWPDFTPKVFASLLETLSFRKRRFGSISEKEFLNTNKIIESEMHIKNESRTLEF